MMMPDRGAEGRRMDVKSVNGWVHRYIQAWRSNDPTDIGPLFTEGASYYTAPWRTPWTGREAIVEGWLDRKDQPGTWTFRHDVLGVDGPIAFVRGWTKYSNGSNYSNLWVIRFEDGKAERFIEWWMEEA